jgi:polyphosphate kinase 2 (PPK2 family)
MGLCAEKDAQRFLKQVPQFEALIVESGITLLKYFLAITEEEQERRFRQQINDPIQRWKLSQVDVASYQRWWDYTQAYDEMLRRTSSNHAPWWVVPADDKERARINCISHILQSIPYQRVKFDAPDLGVRQDKPLDFVEDMTIRHFVPDKTSTERASPTVLNALVTS